MRVRHSGGDGSRREQGGSWELWGGWRWVGEDRVGCPGQSGGCLRQVWDAQSGLRMLRVMQGGRGMLKAPAVFSRVPPFLVPFAWQGFCGMEDPQPLLCAGSRAGGCLCPEERAGGPCHWPTRRR